MPNECGRKEVVIECFNQLLKFPGNDYANELISIINNNPLNNLEIWSESILKFKGVQLTQWLNYAYKLQLIHKIDENILLSIVDEGDSIEKKKRLQLIITGNRIDLINNNIVLKQIVLNGILNNELSAFEKSKIGYSLNFITILLHPYILSNIFSIPDSDSNMTFLSHLNRFFERHPDSSNPIKSISEFVVSDNIDKPILELKKAIDSLLTTPIAKFKIEIEPWDILIENGRKILKDKWAFYIVATIAAGIKSKEESYDDFEELHNPLISLSKRVRCARMKSGNVKYWMQQFNSSEDKLFTLLVLFTWATPKAIIQLLDKLSKTIKTLEPNDFSKLVRGLSRTINISQFNKAQQKYIEEEMKDKLNHNEINYILSLRFNDNNGQKYVYYNIKKYTGIMERAIDQKFQYLVLSFLKEPSNSEILKEIKSSFQNIQNHSERYYYNHYVNESVKIPYEIAKQIMKNCKDYPRIISSFAEKSCRLFANQNIIAVGSIAIKEKWFEGN